MRNKQGEIWLCEIKGKKRPVLIVGNNDIVVEVDRTITTISSQKPRNKYDVVIEQWEEAGLDKPSIVRCSKINTVHYKELLFKIGLLTDTDFDRVRDAIRDYLL